MKYLLYSILILLLMSGCVRRVRHIPMEPVVDENLSKPTGTLYDTSATEAKYQLKPEPYSINSKEKDPELLGPQRTIEPTKKVEEVQASVLEPESQPVTETKTLNTAMTKEECISMIGNTKFERYSNRFGGESGAIKRCAILKKLKKG